MGLFSGSFGTGLVTGLATSIDTSLRDAMKKREEEMTRVQKFEMERKAKKQDEAEKEDKRIEKAYDTLLKEFGGDEAKALAAYQAIPGGIDEVETYLKDVSDTRATADPNYNIVDKFKFDGIDFEEVGDITRERALGSLRTEVKPVDVQMTDTGLLSKIGLGKDDMGAEVSARVNEAIPTRERKAIENLIGGTVDRTGLLTNLKYKQELESSAIGIKKQIENNTIAIMNGKTLDDEILNEADILLLEQQTARLLSSLSNINRAADPSGGGPSASQVASAYNSRLSDLTKTLGLQNQGGVVTVPPQGELLEGEAAVAYLTKQKDEMQDDFVRTAVLDENGDFLSTDAQYQAQALGLGDVIESVRADIGAGKADESAAAARPSDEDATAQVMEMYPTARDMAMAPEVLERVDSAEKLFDRLTQFYPDKSDQELSALAVEAFKNKPAPPAERKFIPQGGDTADTTDTGAGATDTEAEADVPDTPVSAANALREAETVAEYERLLPIYMQLTGREEDDVKRSFPPPAS